MPQAARRARRQRNQDRLRGLPARVPPYAAARWAARLREQGMSAQDIADRAGLWVTLVRRLLRTPEQGQAAGHIARSTADAILGIPLSARRAPSTPGLTGSAETSRLLADLARAGCLPPYSPCDWASTPKQSPKSAANVLASISISRYGFAACTAN
ncbi:hypothetical protein [Streptomyces sp. NPDC007205]|uniref:hypothetical protein n=1 Tax=Streptomyces sp. NPDC007205 TaxID=3154316 RepID=UPI0033F6AED6